MAQMDQEVVAKLEAIQENMGALYEQIETLRSELKAAGHKADSQAFNDPLERMARYGRLFSDILHTWTEPAE